MGAISISVSMCLYNSLRYVDETIESLLAQTFGDFEAILVDDGSTDGTADHIARRYSDPRLKIFRQPNGGMGKARSVSVARAQGEYVAFLDPDDVWLPRMLERQIASAREHPEAALFFSDSLLIDCNSHVVGAMSECFDYDEIDLRTGYAHDELLRRGCFIAMCAAMVRRSELRRFGLPNPTFKYADDYDMWLRLSRNHPVVFLPEVLAKWRMHEASYTETHPDVSVKWHAKIWGPVGHNHTYPPAIRTTVTDHLFGQQRCAIRYLMRHGRPGSAIGIVAEMLKAPGPIFRYLEHRIRRTRPGKILVSIPSRLAAPAHLVWNLLLRIKDFARALPKRIQTRSWAPQGFGIPGIHVWVDGTPLKSAQAGYFNFVCETIRSLVVDKRGFVVHVIVPYGGKSILRERLGSDASKLLFHSAFWDLLGRREKQDSPWLISAANFLSKVSLHLRRSPPRERTAEILIWRGRFRFATSRKVAVIHDVTTRLLPEFHTPENIADFEEFVEYARRNAEMIATVSEQSRSDVVDYLDVRPRSVHVVMSQIHPCYVRPKFDRRVLGRRRLKKPYLFCVSTIEPRKNLRRLVDAFALLKRAHAMKNHVLAIAGPPGWDDTFDQFLTDSPVKGDVRRLGFVPLEDLPSLHHFASVFIYPSLYEGFGLPVLEALCSSAIVLTSNLSSLTEIAGEEIRTFNPADTMSIVEAILNASMMTREEAISYRKRCRSRGKKLLCESAERPSIATLLANPPAEEKCALPSYSRLST